MKKRIIICLVFLIYLLIPQKMPAWSAKTHKLIAQSAILNSILANPAFLKKLNFERGIYFEMFQKENEIKSLRDWIKYGSDVEDTSFFDPPRRSDNHFHNPLKSWAEAGLDDWAVIHLTGFSAILWAQLDHLQEGYPEGINTWDVIRTKFYAGLIAVDLTERQKYFAETFKGLGHQVHLLEDMSVPDHVRNDAHILNTMFPWYANDLSIFRCIEGWAENNLAAIQTFVDPAKTTILFPNINLNRSGPLPLLSFSYLYDNDLYSPSAIPSAGLDLGLSEYTNANFVSEDTIFSAEDPDIPARHQFLYPQKSSTDLQKYIDEGKAPESYIAEDGKTDLVKYIAKIADGAVCNHFLAVGYLTNESLPTNNSNDKKYIRTLFIDNLCHKDYASMLIPRAVGYSATLIDYFFRNANAIEISVPQNGIYAMDVPQDIAYPFGSGFSKLKLMAKNIAAAGVNLENGEIKLVVSYRLGQGDVAGQFKNPPNPPSIEFTYMTASPSTPITAIPRQAVELEFNLDEPILENATDIRLMLVFQGNFENESNNVAIGFKDINEPTPLDCFNNMDKICLFNTWYDAGTDAAANVVDLEANGGNGDGIAQEWDIRKHNMVNVCIKFSPVNNGAMASSTNFDYKFERIDAGEWRRIFVLTDSHFNVSWASEIESVPFGQHSTNWVAYWVPILNLEPAINNSLEYLGYGSPEYGEPPVHMYSRNYPIFSTYRSIANCWDLIGISNREYPANSTCALELLNTQSKASSGLAAAQIMEDENGNSIKLKLKANTGKMYMQKIENRDSQLELQKDKNKK